MAIGNQSPHKDRKACTNAAVTHFLSLTQKLYECIFTNLIQNPTEVFKLHQRFESFFLCVFVCVHRCMYFTCLLRPMMMMMVMRTEWLACSVTHQLFKPFIVICYLMGFYALSEKLACAFHGCIGFSPTLKSMPRINWRLKIPCVNMSFKMLLWVYRLYNRLVSNSEWPPSFIQIQMEWKCFDQRPFSCQLETFFKLWIFKHFYFKCRLKVSSTENKSLSLIAWVCMCSWAQWRTFKIRCPPSVGMVTQLWSTLWWRNGTFMLLRQ